MSVEEWLINGMIDGSVYALLALGYSLVYGVGGIMNLSHGAIYILTGYIVLWALAASFLQLGAISLALIVIILIGAVIYLILIKPLQDKPLAILMTTFALAIVIEQIIVLFTPEGLVKLPPLVEGSGEFLGVRVTNQQILIVIAALCTVVLFTLFINKTKVGTCIRAISQDKEAARLMGINVNRYLMYTLMISSFLAGFAAVINLNFVTPFDGWQALTLAFSIVILGGLGSLGGSILASYIISFVTYYVYFFGGPSGDILAQLVPVVVVVVVLIIRPQGLFGKKERS